MKITFLKTIQFWKLQSKHKEVPTKMRKCSKQIWVRNKCVLLAIFQGFSVTQPTVRTSIPAEKGKQQSVGLPLMSVEPPSLARSQGCTAAARSSARRTWRSAYARILLLSVVIVVSRESKKFHNNETAENSVDGDDGIH